MYSEAEIIEGCRNNNPEFQKIVYEKYAPKMMAICMRYSGNKEEARDLMHDGFVNVFTNFKSYRKEANLDSWISRVMINNKLNFIRKKIKESKAAKYFKQEIELETIEADDDTWLEKYSAEDINSAIMKLTLAKRTVFNLYVIEDFSHKEIARQMGITVGNSKSNLSRAKDELKEILLNKTNRNDE